MTPVTGLHERFRILVAFKLTGPGQQAFAHAARLASRIPGCELHVLHVAVQAFDDAATRPLVEILRRHVDDVLRSLGQVDALDVHVHVRGGEAVESILAVSQQVRADLMLLGSDRGHRAPWDRAPVIERLAEVAECPVLVVAARTRTEEVEGARERTDAALDRRIS